MLLARPEPPVRKLVRAGEVLSEAVAMLEPAARLARVRLVVADGGFHLNRVLDKDDGDRAFGQRGTSAGQEV